MKNLFPIGTKVAIPKTKSLKTMITLEEVIQGLKQDFLYYTGLNSDHFHLLNEINRKGVGYVFTEKEILEARERWLRDHPEDTKSFDIERHHETHNNKFKDCFKGEITEENFIEIKNPFGNMTQKKFKNKKFAVKSNSFFLYEAFKKECEKLGWKYNEQFNSFVEFRMRNCNCLFFSASFNNEEDYLFSFSNIEGNEPVFQLEYNWNEALKAASEVEEIKPMFEVGDYISTSENGIGKITEIGIASMTVDYRGFVKTIPPFKWYKLTPEEIEKHLIEQAEKDGWVKGAKLNYDGKTYTLDKLQLFKRDNSHSYSCATYSKKEKYFLIAIYGGYMSPLPECTLLPKHPDITLAGYKGEFNSEGIKFGCAFILLDDIKNWEKDLSYKTGNYLGQESNIKIEGIKISKGGYEDVLSLSDIKKIVDYFNSK